MIKPLASIASSSMFFLPAGCRILVGGHRHFAHTITRLFLRRQDPSPRLHATAAPLHVRMGGPGGRIHFVEGLGRGALNKHW
jgi:hypothetical protein